MGTAEFDRELPDPVGSKAEALRVFDEAARLREEGRLVEAIDAYSRILMRYPVSEAYNERALVYSDHGDVQKAIIDLTDGIGVNDSDPDLFLNRGNQYFKLQDYEAAIEDYDVALELSPQMAYALNSRGSAYRMLGRFEEAIGDLDAATQFEPTYASPYFNLGVVYYVMDQLDEALKCLDAAHRLQPNDIKTQEVRAEIAQALEVETR